MQQAFRIKSCLQNFCKTVPIQGHPEHLHNGTEFYFRVFFFTEIELPGPSYSPLNEPPASRPRSRVYVTLFFFSRRIFDRVVAIVWSGFQRKRLLLLLVVFYRLSLCFWRCRAASAPEPTNQIYTWASDSSS